MQTSTEEDWESGVHAEISAASLAEGDRDSVEELDSQPHHHHPRSKPMDHHQIQHKWSTEGRSEQYRDSAARW